MLEGIGINKRYDLNLVLSDVSVCVKPGAATVVMGPSGGGKSTLVRSISLIEVPDEGKILLDGKNIVSQYNNQTDSEESPWPKITVVFQQLFLWPNMTLTKNILMPAKLRNLSVNRYKELIEKLDIADVVDRYPNQVSIGQRQRAALIRAILLCPKFLLLDEVTAALDVEQIRALANVLTGCLERNIGLLIVTHHLGFARTLLSYHDAGTFIFLEDGEVIESGDINSFIEPTTKRVRNFFSTVQSVIWSDTKNQNV